MKAIGLSLIAFVAALSLTISPALSVDPATPLDPDAYGAIVSFGAQEDHDLEEGPGNVVGGTRSGIATTSDQGVAPFVRSIREFFGSTPNPPSGQ